MNLLGRKTSEVMGEKSAGMYSGVSDIASNMMKSLSISEETLSKISEKYQDNLNAEEKLKTKHHKEILRVILAATKKKAKGQKRIEENVEKEKKSQKAETKKTEAKTEETAKPAEAPPPPKPEPAPKPEVAPKPTPAPKPEPAPKPTAKRVEEVKPTPSLKPEVPKSVTTATKVSTGGLLAAAAMSVRGETGGKSLDTVSTDAKKVGQVVQNDPKPGVSSYGIFGLNSGGSVQNFVKDNPQFGLSELQPASKQFDERWKNLAIEKTQEFYQAQINWYKKYVYDPVKADMQKLLPQHLGSDDGVVTYMADRRNQMGKLYEGEAITYAKNSNTPKEFIAKIAEHDSSESYIKKAFPTYLKTHGDKNIPGLQNRVRIREEMSIKVSGDLISGVSNENTNMKKDLQQSSGATVVIQQNNNTTLNKQSMIMQNKKQELNPTMR
jgi:hypothetical protein